ncbi:MAG: ferritin-like domain-containing protein [Nocardioidaceae bacterium]
MTLLPAASYVATLQDALAAEHASVYAYGALAGRLATSSPAQERAADGYREHLERRDALIAQVAGSGAVPTPAEPAYAIPVRITGPLSAARVARQVEDRCAVHYAAVVAVAEAKQRAFALDAWTDCATRLLGWDGRATALPGLEQP